MICLFRKTYCLYDSKSNKLKLKNNNRGFIKKMFDYRVDGPVSK